ncbi:MAG: pirin family protein [Planctomycetota bacterium]
MDYHNDVCETIGTGPDRLIEIFHAIDRGITNDESSRCRHTFSFGTHINPSRMGFRSLRVLNEFELDAEATWGPHAYQNMEILTHVTDGTLSFQTSIAAVASVDEPATAPKGESLTTGDWMLIGAGTGASLEMKNLSSRKSAKFWQIWIYPEEQDFKPIFERRHHHDLLQARHCVACRESERSQDSAASPMLVRQDVRIDQLRIKPEEPLTMKLDPSRHAWLQCLRGEVDVSDQSDSHVVTMGRGDGVSVRFSDGLKLRAASDCRLILLDLL